MTQCLIATRISAFSSANCGRDASECFVKPPISVFSLPTIYGFWSAVVTLTFAFGPIAGMIACQAASADERPNVLMIVVDDLGAADLSCLGAKDMRTPHLDKLFDQSLRLDRFYANCPVCSPTRASLLTGYYPDRVGVPGVIRTHASNNWGRFQPQAPTLALALQQAGYRTKAIGKWHLGLEPEDHPMRHGFDAFNGFLGDMMDDYFHHRRHQTNYMRRDRETIDPKGHATELFSRWAVESIEHFDVDQQPWFMYLAYNAPHTPIQPPEGWLRKVRQRERDMSEKRSRLVALIEHLDAEIGSVLSTLEASGRGDRTVVVFTSDNGGQVNVGANNGPIRDGKGSMYEGGLRIPGCLRIPDDLVDSSIEGLHSGAIACTADLMPTILELVSAEVPEGLDGRSLLPIIRDPSFAWPDPREVYFVRREGGRAYGGLAIHGVLQGDWKLVHNLPTASFELYNLAEDPREQKDLAKSHPKRFGELQRRLQHHVQKGGRISWQ